MTAGVLTRSLRVLGMAALFSTSAAFSLWAEPIAVTCGQFRIPFDDPTFFRFFGADGLS